MSPLSSRGIDIPEGFPVEDERLYEMKGAGLLYVDIKGSTKLFRRVGNRKSHARITEYLDYVSAMAESYGGKMSRRLGDGFLFLFPRMDKALEAGIAIQSRLGEFQKTKDLAKMELHTAVHGGRVLVEEIEDRTEIYGQVVERTLSLLDNSVGGDVIIDYRLLEHPQWAESIRGRSFLVGSNHVRLFTPEGKNASVPLPDSDSSKIKTRFTQRATMFTDLKGWSQMYGRHGRRKSYATVKAYQAYVRRIVVPHNGQIVKTTGEGMMVSFKNPTDAIRAAAEMQTRVGRLRAETPLGDHVVIRTGISYGRVLVEQRGDAAIEDHFGNTVNTAARMMARSERGEIVLSEVVLKDLGVEALLEGANVRYLRAFPKGIEDGLTVLHVDPASIASRELPPDGLGKALRRVVDAAGRAWRNLTKT